MASSDSTPDAAVSSQAPAAPLSSRKENMPISPKIAELNESRQELLSRIQNLKQDLQNWRFKLDSQVKVHRDELSELKKSLNLEVDELRSEFQELRNVLQQQQQEDVTASLKKFGLDDVPAGNKDAHAPEIVKIKAENNQDSPQGGNQSD